MTDMLFFLVSVIFLCNKSHKLEASSRIIIFPCPGSCTSNPNSNLWPGDGSSVWASATLVGDLDEVLAPGFDFAHCGCCGCLRNEPTDERS